MTPDTPAAEMIPGGPLGGEGGAALPVLSPEQQRAADGWLYEVNPLRENIPERFK